jgi:hypothetical protein
MKRPIIIDDLAHLSGALSLRAHFDRMAPTLDDFYDNANIHDAYVKSHLGYTMMPSREVGHIFDLDEISPADIENFNREYRKWSARPVAIVHAAAQTPSIMWINEAAEISPEAWAVIKSKHNMPRGSLWVHNGHCTDEQLADLKAKLEARDMPYKMYHAPSTQCSYCGNDPQPQPDPWGEPICAECLKFQFS